DRTARRSAPALPARRGARLPRLPRGSSRERRGGRRRRRRSRLAREDSSQLCLERGEERVVGCGCPDADPQGLPEDGGGGDVADEDAAAEERDVQLAGGTRVLFEEDEGGSRRVRRTASILEGGRDAFAFSRDQPRPLRNQLRVREQLAGDQARGRAEVVRQLDLAQLRAERRGGEQRPAAQRGGGERLGEGAKKDEARVPGEQRGEILPAEV